MTKTIEQYQQDSQYHQKEIIKLQNELKTETDVAKRQRDILHEILNTALRNLGFEAATHNDLRDFKGIPKEDILNLYGIPMRPSKWADADAHLKWADVWFAILEDDVYIVVNGNQVYEYGHMGDAIKGIQKIAIQQKKNHE